VSETPTLCQRDLLRAWLPLWATWLMMAFEGPYLAAIIARLPDPTLNLAAYGVAFAFALIVESPVIMMMSASTALVRDARSLAALRRFARRLNVAVTVAMVAVLAPLAFTALAEGAIGLPGEVADLTWTALVLLLPWPGAIGYRRFWQGVMIRHRRSRRVAAGTVVRLVAMSATAAALAAWGTLPGAAVGAAALTAGVCAEAVASRMMVADLLPALASTGELPESAGLDLRAIWRFYLPLALTSLLAMGVQPMVTFFVGRSRFALESLAVLPVVTGLVFVFRSFGLAYQEVAIAQVGDGEEHRRPVTAFAALLAAAAAGGLALLAWTPLAGVWFDGVAGLPPELGRFALAPTRVLAIMPALTVAISYQRALLVARRATAAVTWASLAEIVGVAVVMTVAIAALDAVGAVAAAAGLVLGRLAAIATLVAPLRRTRPA